MGVMKISSAVLLTLIFVSMIILSLCKSTTPTFGDDLAFLKKFTNASFSHISGNPISISMEAQVLFGSKVLVESRILKD